MTDEEASAQNEQLIRAYHVAFSGPAGQAVMADLARFCRATETCVVPGNRDATFVLEGRREAFLRIQQLARLTVDEIMQLRLERMVPPRGEENG